jgi:hypothetical protein
MTGRYAQRFGYEFNPDRSPVYGLPLTERTIDTHSTERRIISSDSTRELSRQSRRDSGVVQEERQVRSHAFTAGEYAQAVE